MEHDSDARPSDAFNSDPHDHREHKRQGYSTTTPVPRGEFRLKSGTLRRLDKARAANKRLLQDLTQANLRLRAVSGRVQQMEQERNLHIDWNQGLCQKVEQLRQQLHEQERTMNERFAKEQSAMIDSIKSTWKKEMDNQRQAIYFLETQLNREREEYAELHHELTDLQFKDEASARAHAAAIALKTKEIASLDEKFQLLTAQVALLEKNATRLEASKRDELISLNEILRKRYKVTSAFSTDLAYVSSCSGQASLSMALDELMAKSKAAAPSASAPKAASTSGSNDRSTSASKATFTSVPGESADSSKSATKLAGTSHRPSLFTVRPEPRPDDANPEAGPSKSRESETPPCLSMP
jgi:hypothetical protein